MTDDPTLGTGTGEANDATVSIAETDVATLDAAAFEDIKVKEGAEKRRNWEQRVAAAQGKVNKLTDHLAGAQAALDQALAEEPEAI